MNKIVSKQTIIVYTVISLSSKFFLISADESDINCGDLNQFLSSTYLPSSLDI